MMSHVRWFRVFGLVLAVGLALLAATWLGGRWWVARYLQSEKFRRLISQQTAAALGADGEFLPLHWSGNSVYSDGFYAQGWPESALRDIRLDQIRATVAVTGFFRRAWRVQDLEIKRLQATLQGWERPFRCDQRNQESASRAEGRSHNLGPIRIQEANLRWPMGAASRVHVVLAPTTAGWEASGSGGELMFHEWPVMKMGAFRVRSQDQTLFITECRLELADGGRFDVTGEVRAGTPDLLVRYAEVPVRNWLPADWRGRLTGLAGGQGTVRGQTVEGTITLAEARLEALPVLEQIAAFTRTAQFRQVALAQASAVYAWQPGRLTVRQAALESPGLLRVEGGCVVEHDMVAGEFEVGVADSTLRWLPGARTRVFTVERDGYRWTTVRLRGPVTAIEEDLSGRLIAAAGTEAVESATGLLESGAQEFFKLLRKFESPVR